MIRGRPAGPPLSGLLNGLELVEDELEGEVPERAADAAAVAVEHARVVALGEAVAHVGRGDVAGVDALLLELLGDDRADVVEDVEAADLDLDRVALCVGPHAGAVLLEALALEGLG